MKKGIFLALSALVLSSCGASEAGKVDPQTAEILANYSASNPDISAAYDYLIEKCMNSKGLAYEASYDEVPLTSLAGLAGIVESEEKANQGYAGTYKENQISDEQREALYGSKDSPTVEISLSSGVTVSVKTDGCVSQAEKEIYGSVEDAAFYKNFINELKVGEQSDSFEKIIESAQEEIESYKKCILEDTGIEVESPEDLEKKVVEKFGQYRLPGQEAVQEEKQIALAAYGCQEESHLVEKTNEEYLKNISQWLTENEEMILRVRDIEEVSQENSVKIINS